MEFVIHVIGKMQKVYIYNVLDMYRSIKEQM
jgi:hypothetical protein